MGVSRAQNNDLSQIIVQSNSAHMVKQSQFGRIDLLYIFNEGSLTLCIKGELHSKILYVYLKNSSCILIFKATRLWNYSTAK